MASGRGSLASDGPRTAGSAANWMLAYYATWFAVAVSVDLVLTRLVRLDGRTAFVIAFGAGAMAGYPAARRWTGVSIRRWAGLHAALLAALWLLLRFVG